MCRAVLAAAIEDCRVAVKRWESGAKFRDQDREAWLFVFGEPVPPVMRLTFEGLCEALDLDPAKIRELMPHARPRALQRGGAMKRETEE